MEVYPQWDTPVNSFVPLWECRGLQYVGSVLVVLTWWGNRYAWPGESQRGPYSGPEVITNVVRTADRTGGLLAKIVLEAPWARSLVRIEHQVPNLEVGGSNPPVPVWWERPIRW